MKLFAEAGLEARIVQIADEKQTIVNLVLVSRSSLNGHRAWRRVVFVTSGLRHPI
jgi:hypothetical protein